jgi:hypothetical protein
MRSKDVLEVFEEANIDTPVSIIPEKFPHYAKYAPPKPKIIVAAPTPKPTPAPVAVAKPTPAVVPSAKAPASVVAAAKPPTSTPAPAPVIASATARKNTPAAPAPAPIAEYRPTAAEPTVVIGHSNITISNVSNAAVSHAMQGSILSAGLPDAPTIVTSPEPTAPKDVTRFGALNVPVRN